MKNSIEVINLSKKYKSKSVVNNINFKINENEIVGLLGPNGCGKTTTIGKIGKIFQDNNSKVIFAACDTFRAAAIEQLEEWSKRISVDTIKSSAGSDPASVAFKAVNYAKLNNLNKVLIDTTNDHIEFYVDVSSSSVQQLYIADGLIAPVTDSDVDLGTSSLYFKNAFIDSSHNLLAADGI